MFSLNTSGGVQMCIAVMCLERENKKAWPGGNLRGIIYGSVRLNGLFRCNRAHGNCIPCFHGLMAS